MRTATLNSIKAHAKAQFPNECCGLIISTKDTDTERYIPCENKSSGTNHFIMNAEDYANAEDLGTIIAVVHSHPNYPAIPSEADKVACEASGLPWFIISICDGEPGEIHSFAPSGYKAPLIGRMFYHGVLDCYSLIEDFYQRELNIKLPKFERNDGWWNGEEELYLNNFEKAGFFQVKDGSLLPNDVILMQYHSKRTNHGGIFIGNNKIKEAPDLFPVQNAMLHHIYGRLSCRVVYGGHWQNITRMVIRYAK